MVILPIEKLGKLAVWKFLYILYIWVCRYFWHNITGPIARRSFSTAPSHWRVAVFLIIMMGARLAHAQTGSVLQPFTALSQVNSVSSSGRYYFDLGAGLFQASVRVESDGPWVLIGQYHHSAGTNPDLNIIGAGADLPVDVIANLGVDYSDDLSRWGHAGNAAMRQFSGNIETWFLAETSAHSRIIDFHTAVGDDYVRSGHGDFTGLASDFTTRSKHSASLPMASSDFLANQGDAALTAQPFATADNYYWNIKGDGHRWEVDDANQGYNFHTQHKIFVRQIVDRGGPSGSCVYVHDFDGEIPYYDSTPFYRTGNIITQNGQHVASAGKIITDASGRGKFIYHATALISSIRGEMFGTPDLVSVQPNSYYTLSFKLASNDNGSKLATIMPKINDVELSPSAVSPDLSGTWQTFEFVWYSGLSTSADISLQNFQKHFHGNDFGLDDISLCPVSTTLEVHKSVNVWDPNAFGLYALPGNDVIYTINITNEGSAATDNDSLVLIDAVPPEINFYNGDIDDTGAEIHPIAFHQSEAAGIHFNYSTDVRFSNSAARPESFSDCKYRPASGYDPNVTYVCINPKGQLLAGNPDPSMSLSFRGRIK